MTESILICEDDATTRQLATRILTKAGWSVDSVSTGEDCLEAYGVNHRVVLLDLGLPGIGGLETLLRLRNINPELKVIILTSTTDPSTIVAALKSGAANYIAKPIRPAELIAAVQELLGSVDGSGNDKERLIDSFSFSKSTLMQKVVATIEKVGQTSASVLVVGETGTGKEVVARKLHELSSRTGNFIAVNCPAIPANLAEAELFGHERGSFTGATQKRDGKILLADHGTLFLDEVADLAPEIQAKLLRVLQEREIEPVGSRTSIAVDIRIIAATSRDLRQLTQTGKFREDLFYRICDVELRVPPLRERLEDLPELVRFFADEFAQEVGGSHVAFTDWALNRLASHQWPGNVRELRGVVRRLIIMSGGLTVDENVINEQSQIQGIVTTPTGASIDSEKKMELAALIVPPTGTVVSNNFSLEEHEKALIRAALVEHKFNVSKAAKALGLGRTTIYRKMKKYGIET